MDEPLEIKPSQIKGAGQGVFARRPFAPGEVVMANPVITFADAEAAVVARLKLGHYYFRWHTDHDGCVVLGYGSLVNHSYTPNCDYERDFQSNRMVFVALRPIRAGEELTINYNGIPDDRTPLGFDTFDQAGRLIAPAQAEAHPEPEPAGAT